MAAFICFRASAPEKPRARAIKRRYSVGVISAYSGGISGRYPMRFFASSGSSKMSCPSIVTSPSVAARQPVMMFIVVDLPAPFGPRNPYTLPFSMVKLTSDTAVCAPYRLVK